jgi:hypothetical protein
LLLKPPILFEKSTPFIPSKLLLLARSCECD